MNDLETSQSRIEMPSEISEQISQLQRQVFMLLLLLVIISGSFVAFVYYQSRQLGKGIEDLNQKAVPIAQLYQQKLPVIQSFIQQLATYGQTHPDFQQQVLNKYGITVQSVAKLKK